ncbi:cobalamin biosynthesis protein [Rhodococcus aerolatus]
MLLGLAADRLLGDPRRFHPVAGFGAVAAALETRVHRDSRAAGAGYAALLVGACVAAGAAAPGGVLGTAVATWAVLGGTSLTGQARALAAELERGDLDAARRRLPWLCGRDPAGLDTAALARAACESVAENTSDATVAPLLWGAVAGVPGLLGYRALNTLDAMVGHRSPRHERFGWAAARADDVANLAPARLGGALTLLVAPLLGGDAAAGWRAWRADAASHPSPNAGVVEAAAAGVLGVSLGGTTTYAYGTQERPVLGRGRAPGPADLRRAAALSTAVQVGAAVVSAALAVAVGQHRARRG